MMGCQYSISTEQANQIRQGNLLVKCEEDLPLVTGKDGESWLKMAREWSSQYHECKERNNIKVDLFNEILSQ